MYLKLLSKFIILLFVFVLLGCSPAPLDDLGKKYDKLSQEYQVKLLKKPKDVALRLELAHFYYDFRDYKKVVKLLKDQKNKAAKVLLAKTLVGQKDYDYAIKVFEKLGEIADAQYLYLYGQTLEEKNLFPKALEIYAKTGPPFRKKAQARIKAIKVKVEEGVPDEILQISKQAQDFLKSLVDDAAVYLLVDEKIQINDDNTSLFTVHVIEKILKERGKELAEVEIGYDSTYERVELEFARTITKDSKVLYAGEENIRDMGLYRNFPLYSNSRAFVISMPSVEVGSIIEYKIKIHSSKLPAKDNFNFLYRLREYYPVFKSNFEITTPKDKEANFRFLNQEYSEGINLNPKISATDKQITYSWGFERIDPIIPEYSMPAFSYINPAIMISSFSSWDQIYKWWRSLYEDKFEVTKEMKVFLQDLIKGKDKDLDKAKVIYEYVAKNIRYVAIEYGDSGYEPHHAKEVFVNGYGDCKDQAILLIALLKEAGLKAYPVLIPTRSAYPIDESFPSINFNHAIAALGAKEGLIFMDPTSETTPFRKLPLSDQQRQVLVFLNNSWRIENTGQIKENEISYSMDIELNEEENALIKRSISSSGFFASGYRYYLKYTHPAKIKENIQKKMAQISSLSELLEYKIENADDFDASPLLSYTFTAGKFLNPAGGLRIVSALDQIGLDAGIIGKDTRNYPIDFDGIYAKSAKIRIELPQNLRVKYLPRSTQMQNPWFKLEVSYKNTSDGIDFYQKFETKKRFVEKDKYQEFKKHFEDAIYLLREEIILEKIR